MLRIVIALLSMLVPTLVLAGSKTGRDACRMSDDGPVFFAYKRLK